jgi:hypothetical protein
VLHGPALRRIECIQISSGRGSQHESSPFETSFLSGGYEQIKNVRVSSGAFGIAAELGVQDGKHRVPDRVA